MNDYRFRVIKDENGNYLVVDTLNFVMRYYGDNIKEYLDRLNQLLQSADENLRKELEWELSEVKKQLEG